MSMQNIPMTAILAGKMIVATSYITVDATDEAAAFCGRYITPLGANKTITHVCLQTNTMYAASTVSIRIETLDPATGNPTGTLIAEGATGTLELSAYDDNVLKEVALATPFTLTSGTYLAIVISYYSGGSNRFVTASSNTEAYGHEAYVKTTTDGGATWTLISYKPSCALKTSGNEYIIGHNGCIALIAGSWTIGTGSTTQYMGNRIRFPYAVRLIGAHTPMEDYDNDLGIGLYDASGNLLKADNASTDMWQTISSIYRGTVTGRFETFAMFPYHKTLAANTDYYLCFRPNGNATANATYRMGWWSEALKKQDMGIPDGWIIQTVTSPATIAWTELAASISNVLPVIDQIDMGGGLLVHPSMNGGMRG